MKKYFLTIAFLLSVISLISAKTSRKNWKIGVSDWYLIQNTDSAFNAMKTAGFDYMELSEFLFYDDNYTSDSLQARIKNVRQRAKKFGITIWSVHLPYSHKLDISQTDENGRQQAVSDFKSIINECKILGKVKLILHPSLEPVKPEEREARIAACKKSLRELDDFSDGQPYQIAVEDLPRSCIGNTIKEFMSLLEGTKNLRICFDTNHFLYDNPEDFVPVAGKKIVTLHVSDYDQKNERHWMPGTGIIKWNKLISNLENTNYKGVFMFEVNPKQKGSYKTFEDLYKSYQLILNY